MKTFILRLETQDDATSIRDKLAWAKAPRVLLAFPKRRPPVLSRMDIILIQRAASQMGGQLAFTTRHPETIKLAKQLGIPNFTSIQSAQRMPWLTADRKHRLPVRRRSEPADLVELRKGLIPKPDRPAPNLLRYTAFTLGAVAFLSLVLLFVPEAVIEVPVTVEVQTINMTVRPTVGITSVLPGVQIPAAAVHTTVAGQMETVATGEMLVPDAYAKTTLVVTNQTDRSIPIPAGTVFTTSDSSPVRFLTQSKAELAAGIGQTVELQALAELPGSFGNLPAGSINAAEGPIGLLVKVTNTTPAEGGTDRPGRSASESDYSQLYDALITSLIETAVHNLEALYGNELMIISESMKVDRIVEEQRQPAVNTPADRARLSLVVDISGLAVSRNDLEAAAAPSMDAALPQGKSAKPGSYSFQGVNPPLILSDGRISWDIQASRSVAQTIQFQSIPALVKGLQISDAQQIVQNHLGLNHLPAIYLNPSWWPRLPLIPFRIEVTGT